MENYSENELAVLLAYYNGDVANSQIARKYGVKTSSEVDDARTSLQERGALEYNSYNATSDGSIKFDNGLKISDLGMEILQEHDFI